MDNKEFLHNLFQKKAALIKEIRDTVSEIESRADRRETGEDKQKLDNLEKELGEHEERIKHITLLEDSNKRDAEQREKFENMLVVPTDRQEHELEARIRNFMRAALPDATEWGPRSIDIDLAEQRDLSVGTATAGGNLVPTGFVRTLQDFLEERAAIRRTNAEVLRTSSGENLQHPKVTGHGSAAIVGEGTAIPESDPTFGQLTLGAFKYGTLVQVTSELIQDNAVDLPGFLARNAGLQIGQANGAHLVTGTGTGQPEGISNSGTVGKTGATGQTTTVTGDDLIDLFHSVTSGYRARAFWVMNDLTAASVRKLKVSTNDQYLWQPGLQAGQPDLLLGRPVITDPNMPTMAANALSIAFGDFFFYYKIRDVRTVRFERSDDFAFANDLVTFRVLFRTDARQAINGADAAVKFYQNSAT